jgi:hypothetical protein
MPKTHLVDSAEPGKVILDITFIGGPIDEPLSAAVVFAALGIAAAQWARLEQHIDAVLIQVNKSTHSEKLFNPDHPVSFSRKIVLLKRWFNSHPGLKSHRDNIKELTSRLKILAKERNQYLHSVVTGFNPQSSTVQMSGIQYMSKGRFRFSKYDFPLTAITSFSEVVHTGNRLLWSISEALFTESGILQLKTL